MMLQGGGADDPHQYARLTLSECRGSCRVGSIRHSYLELFIIQAFYLAQQLTILPDMVQLYGGLEDYVLDPFGFEYPLCAENGGFTSTGRDGWYTLCTHYSHCVAGLMFYSSMH